MRRQPSLLLLPSLLLILIVAPVTKGWVVSTSERLTRKARRQNNNLLRIATLSRSQGLAMSKDGDDQHGGQTALRVLGVCGGIGSGKSQACRILVSELGCVAHIDADSLAHIVYEPGSQAVQEIADLFGSDILQESGEIDRKRLGGIVFTDKAAMSKLEHIVWPHVKTEIKKRIAILRDNMDPTKVPVVVLEAAMLLDAEWEDLLDGLWVVTAPRATALERLVNDRGLTLEDAATRMDAQESRRGIGNLKEEISQGTVTACIQNTGSLEDLTRTLKEALVDPKLWKNSSAAPNQT